jgi:hypothetical protein
MKKWVGLAWLLPFDELGSGGLIDWSRACRWPTLTGRQLVAVLRRDGLRVS